VIISLSNPGAGVIKDKEAYDIPKDFWSNASNVRFNDGYAEKFLGHSSTLGTPSIAPYFLLPFQTTSLFYWIYAGLNKVYVTEGDVHKNITRSSGDYNATADEGWTGGVLGGIPILCNGIDAPQMLFPASPSNTLSELSNWPSNTLAEVVRPFKNYLVALNVNEGGEKYPYVVRWSHPADPGTVPTSWDYADATKDAGRQPLSESGGVIIDGGSLRDSFIIYRENATWEMRFIGGRFIFSFRQIFPNTGIFAKRCFIEFEGKHFVLTSDDLIVHDGATSKSVLDGKYRNTLFDELRSATNSKRTYLAANYAKNEVWVCYPTSSASLPNKALVWNWRHDSLGFRALPSAAHIAFDVVDAQTNATWDTLTGTWDTWTGSWDDRRYDPSKRAMLLADPTDTKLYELDSTNQFDGINMTATLERTGLLLTRNDEVDFDSIKRINRVYPKMSGSGDVTIYIGYQMAANDAVTWDLGTTFTIGTDHKVDVRASGRLMAIKIKSAGDVSWKLHGIDLDVDKVGRR